MYVCGEVVTAGGRVERTLFDGLLTDELVQLLLLEIEQLIVATGNRVDQLVLHVELRHHKHCTRKHHPPITVYFLSTTDVSTPDSVCDMRRLQLRFDLDSTAVR